STAFPIIALKVQQGRPLISLHLAFHKALSYQHDLATKVPKPAARICNKMPYLVTSGGHDLSDSCGGSRLSLQTKTTHHFRCSPEVVARVAWYYILPSALLPRS